MANIGAFGGAKKYILKRLMHAHPSTSVYASHGSPYALISILSALWHQRRCKYCSVLNQRIFASCERCRVRGGGMKMSMFAKNLAPYRMGKRPHKQNRAQIHQKYRKSYFLSTFDVFLGYFEGCCVFLSCRGPSLSQVYVLFLFCPLPMKTWLQGASRQMPSP